MPTVREDTHTALCKACQRLACRKVHQDTHGERQEGLDTLLASAMAAKTAVHGLPPRVAQDAVAATHWAYSHSSIQKNTCIGMLGDQSS